MEKLFYDMIKDEFNSCVVRSDMDAVLGKWKVYYDKITDNSLTIDDYTSIKENDNSYLCNFLERESDAFASSRPAGSSRSYMVYRRNKKDDKEKESDFKENPYYILKPRGYIGSVKIDNKGRNANKVDSEKFFDEYIKPLLKGLIDASASSENLLTFLNGNNSYDSYVAKQILHKIMLLTTSMNESNDLFGKLPHLFDIKVIDRLIKEFEIDVDANHENWVGKGSLIMEKCYEILDVKPSCENASKISQILWKIETHSMDVNESSPNVIYYGAPGTGKTFGVKEAIRIATKNKSDEQSVIIQCHPGFGYEDFIEGLKPVGITENGTIKFEVVNGVFKEFCMKAKEQPDKDFYFVADEINRANLSAMFGEVLSALEVDYRDDPQINDNTMIDNKSLVLDKADIDKNSGKRKNNLVKTPLSTLLKQFIEGEVEKVEEKAREDKRNELYKKYAYAWDKDYNIYFGVPKNVRFIGMMNDVDKSIDAFDLALRRRFKWIRKDFDDKVISDNLLFPIDSKLRSYEGNEVGEYIENCKQLNEYISDLNGLGLGPSYQFGHAYYMKIRLYANKKLLGEPAKSLFDEHLAPVLKEYLRSIKEESEILPLLKQAKNIFVGSSNFDFYSEDEDE